MILDTCSFSGPLEIIKGKLYWISSVTTPKQIPKTFFFNIDTDLVYEPLFSDFGPLDIGQTFKYVLQVKRLLKSNQFSDCRIYHHTSLDSAKRANAAFLMGAYQVLMLGRTAEEAWEPFSKVKPEFAPFRDALDGSCDYKCTILDCLKGLEYAVKLGWFEISSFDIKIYEQCGKVDVNWIIPGRFLAFSEPCDSATDEEGCLRFIPEDYLAIFNKMKVKTIVRLNSKKYNKNRFTQLGFHHYDLDTSDSMCPSNENIDAFLEVCEKEKGLIAIHCKSGLGHTCTMIACYAMKHYHFPAAALIGWMRLCRPGSIFGKQQHFLVSKEKELCNFSEGFKTLPELTCQDLDSKVEAMIQQQPYVFKSPKPSPSQSKKNDVQQTS